MSDFTKIRSLVSALMHADKRADEHDEINSRFFRLFERAWKPATLPTEA